jgi:hypothetical protein
MTGASKVTRQNGLLLELSLVIVYHYKKLLLQLLQGMIEPLDD